MTLFRYRQGVYAFRFGNETGKDGEEGGVDGAKKTKNEFWQRKVTDLRIEEGLS